MYVCVISVKASNSNYFIAIRRWASSYECIDGDTLILSICCTWLVTLCQSQCLCLIKIKKYNVVQWKHLQFFRLAVRRTMTAGVSNFINDSHYDSSSINNNNNKKRRRFSLSLILCLQYFFLLLNTGIILVMLVGCSEAFGWNWCFCIFTSHPDGGIWLSLFLSIGGW